jgi:hypothetical protein
MSFCLSIPYKVEFIPVRRFPIAGESSNQAGNETGGVAGSPPLSRRV